jgi:hypothetical protein
MSEQTMYIPAAQVSVQYLSLVHVWFQPDWIVRTAGPVAGLTAEMQRALTSADPNLPASGFYGMGDLLARSLATQRIEVALLGAMAGLALLLRAVGIFALVANMVAQRTREIGIRMALGSTVGQAMVQIGRSGGGVAASVVGLFVRLLLCAGAACARFDWRCAAPFVHRAGVVGPSGSPIAGARRLAEPPRLAVVPLATDGHLTGAAIPVP